MPRLLLLRHAKSAAGDPGMKDADRPLAARGRRSAPLVGQHLAEHSLIPNSILCSTARRTRETLAGLLGHLEGDILIRLTGALYEPHSGHYLDVITRFGETARTLLLIGHNPAIQETAHRIIGSGNDALRREAAGNFPTAALAVIDIDELHNWKDLKPGGGRIVAFFRPRDLEVVGAEPSPNDE